MKQKYVQIILIVRVYGTENHMFSNYVYILRSQSRHNIGLY